LNKVIDIAPHDTESFDAIICSIHSLEMDTLEYWIVDLLAIIDRAIDLSVFTAHRWDDRDDEL